MPKDPKPPSKRVAAEAEGGKEEEAETENGNKRRRTSGAEVELPDDVVEAIERSPEAIERSPEAIERSPEAGLLLVGGGTNWDAIGRKEGPKGSKAPPTELSVANLYGPHVWSENIRVRTVASSCVACHSALVTEDGKVYTWGRNEKGQLGLGDTETRYEPTLVEQLEGETIVKIATGRSHTLFLTEEGVVYSCGANKMAQLGQGNEGKDKLVPEKIKYSGKPIVKIACGAEFSMIVDVAGGLHSFGSPEYGQLGHNTEGSSLERAGKVSFTCESSPRIITRFVEKDKKEVTPIFQVSIADVQCGVNHTIAVDKEGRVFTWGFGGYGRLGHADNKDELVPRQVTILDNLRIIPTHIAAGSTFCLVTSGTKKMTYFWGQTKTSGEATMYPKPLHDLNGWNIQSIGCCNRSIVVVADESVISWGPSPTYGELLYGDNCRVRSSTVPQEAKPMSGMPIKEVACGFGHVLMIAKDITEEQRQKISQLPKWPVKI